MSDLAIDRHHQPTSAPEAPACAGTHGCFGVTDIADHRFPLGGVCSFHTQPFVIERSPAIICNLVAEPRVKIAYDSSRFRHNDIIDSNKNKGIVLETGDNYN